MRICKNCIHYNVCEYSTIADKEVDCKDFISNTIKADTIRKMQERLKAETITIQDHTGKLGSVIIVSTVDQIAKEMLEENNGIH